MNTVTKIRLESADVARELTRLPLSEILDRQIELQKITDFPDSVSAEELTEARTMLRATYNELGRRYRK